MTLREARVAFTFALAQLVLFAKSKSLECAFAEGMDRITEKDPTTDHMKGLLHEIGLAQDIDLYINGVYQTTTEAHLALGEWWEQYGLIHHLPLRWGGRFKNADGNHYECNWRK